MLWSDSGRAIFRGRDEGVTELLFDDSPEAHGHGKILGGGMVGTHAGEMIGEIAFAIELGADAVDIGKTIHPPSWAKALAWRRRWRMVIAPTCRRRGSRPDPKLSSQSPNWKRCGLFSLALLTTPESFSTKH